MIERWVRKRPVGCFGSHGEPIFMSFDCNPNIFIRRRFFFLFLFFSPFLHSILLFVYLCPICFSFSSVRYDY